MSLVPNHRRRPHRAAKSYDGMVNSFERRRGKVGSVPHPGLKGMRLHWWLGGMVRKRNGDIVPVCIGPFPTDDAARVAAYDYEFVDDYDTFQSKHSTVTDATREYRMRRADKGARLSEVLENTRHTGKDIRRE